MTFPENEQKATSFTPEYIYKGDKLTDSAWKNGLCRAVRRQGKCIRGKNGNMLVEFDTGDWVVVLARQLRKIK